ncbi:hypothetical protein G6F56_008932 [Rhizopus delemar]|uniref:ADF-H domain-containing protein n=1 Tax=Rhizopus stolonifer TaxID=4846 RepID=A0A367KWT3_RHIST|nr:hypothetical protein G6F56_008932 [Rhizopus delemar]RCI06624.1 hypothetical protein CU098_013439 [Rhizopus stolonifer]
MCDVSDPRILNAYYGITEDEPVNWLLAGYKDSRNVIILYSSGTNGLSEFREHLTNEILFGFIRVEDKFVLVTYVPDSVNGVRRARALVHSRSVAAVCPLAHAQLTASSLSDLSDSNIRTRLKLDQIPNRPRSNPKRASINSIRRRSTLYVPESTLDLQTTDEPETYDAPTSPTFSDSTTVVESTEDKEETPESVLQSQLRKKREMDEARFRQNQPDSGTLNTAQVQPPLMSNKTSANLTKTAAESPPIAAAHVPKRAQSQPMMVQSPILLTQNSSVMAQSQPTTMAQSQPTTMAQSQPTAMAQKSSTMVQNQPAMAQNLHEKKTKRRELSVEIPPRRDTTANVLKKTNEKDSVLKEKSDSETISKEIIMEGFVSVQVHPIPVKLFKCIRYNWTKRFFSFGKEDILLFKQRFCYFIKMKW